jgi:hypothetical protein
MRLGTRRSRWALLAFTVTFSVALLVGHLTDLREPVSIFVMWTALFAALGLTGPALVDDGVLAVVWSIAISVIGGFVCLSALFAFACAAHGQCL